MRELTDHFVKGDSVNHQLRVVALDEPGAGGANHKYAIAHNENILGEVDFQNGPIKEVGVNGVTHEAHLAIFIDRMRSFQAGPYACESNQLALDHAISALMCLRQRTIGRMERNVEGTHTV